MPTNLSLPEMKALLYIKQSLARDESPTVRDVSQHLGYSSSQSGLRLIRSLIDQGVVERDANKKLRLRKLNAFPGGPSTKTVELPILGYVACGSPILAEESIEGYLRVSESIVSRGKEHFILRAMGDSMENADIFENDYLVIRKDAVIHNGDIVLAFIDDEATIKRYVTTRNGFVLKPESDNTMHTPIVADEYTTIIGKVVHTIGKWD